MAWSQWFVTALADGALVGDLNGFYRFDNFGKLDPTYGWSGRLAVWDVNPAGELVGVLQNTSGEGVLRQPDGTPARPVGTMKVPVSYSSYSFLRIASDGSYWLALGGSGSPTDPAIMLFKLNGTVTPLSLVTQPQSQTVNAGSSVTFIAGATGTSKIQYQWLFNGVVLPGQTNATLVINNAQPSANGDYTVTVSNRSGSITSRPATLVVLSAPEILSVSGGGSLNLGNTLTLYVNARGLTPLTYLWRKNATPIAGATNATYSIRAVSLTDAGNYDVTVSNRLGSTTSSPIAVTVTAQPGSVITSFPDLNYGLGVKELSVLPNGDFLGDGTVYNRFGEKQFSVPVTTTDLREKIVVNPNLGRIYMLDGPKFAFDLKGNWISSIPAVNGTLGRLEPMGTLLVGTAGAKARRVTADGTILTNFLPAMASMDMCPLPDGKIALVNYTMRISGGNYVYDTVLARLQPDGSLDTSFSRSTNVFTMGNRAERVVSDRAGRLLVFGAFENFNGQPRSRIARFLADGSLDSSFLPPIINGEIFEVAEQLNGKLVIVGAFTQVDGQRRSLIARLNGDGSHDLSFNPGTGLTKSSGQNVAFDVKLLPTGEIIVAGTFDSANGIPRKGLAMFTGDALDLFFTREPTSAEVFPGGSVELSALGSGSSPVTYQWYKNGNALIGSTQPTLKLENADVSTAGSYFVAIRNASGELRSRVITVTVLAAPIIITAPASLVVDYGTSASFQVVADGLRLAYQWYFKGVAITGKTNASLTIDSVQDTAAGNYSVTISNPAGTASATALLRVRPKIVIGGNIPTNGLTGEFLFEGNFAEKSGRIPTTIKGAPTLVDGINGGKAARFRSQTDWLQLGTSTAVLGETTYSVSFWIWPEENYSVNVYSLTLFVGAQKREHYLYLGGSDTTVQGQRIFLATRGTTSVHSSDGRAYVPNLAGKWTHIVVTYRGNGPNQANNYTVYINGTPIPLVNSSNTIGGSGAGNGLATYGPATTFRLDDFRLYSRALSADEAVALGNMAPPTAKPSIIAQPAGGSAADGGTFSFNVQATGENLFYEWYRGNTLLADKEGPTLTLTNLTAADAGDYRVVISNSGGSLNSSIATLTVNSGSDPFIGWASSSGLSGRNALPDADPDGDGINNLTEFAFGTSPSVPDKTQRIKLVKVTADGAVYPAINFTRRAQLGTTRINIRIASTALFKDSLGTKTVSVTARTDGLEDVVIQSTQPITSSKQQYFQITVQK